VFAADPTFGEASREALREARARGAVVACEIVWAEVAAAFAGRAPTAEALDQLGVNFSPANVFAAVEAGVSWRNYRRSGGTRERIIADFLVASHAQVHADRLLTRDRGFYRSHFAGLTVVDPTTSK